MTASNDITSRLAKFSAMGTEVKETLKTILFGSVPSNANVIIRITGSDIIPTDDGFFIAGSQVNEYQSYLLSGDRKTNEKFITLPECPDIPGKFAMRYYFFKKDSDELSDGFELLSKFVTALSRKGCRIGYAGRDIDKIPYFTAPSEMVENASAFPKYDDANVKIGIYEFITMKMVNNRTPFEEVQYFLKGRNLTLSGKKCDGAFRIFVKNVCVWNTETERIASEMVKEADERREKEGVSLSKNSYLSDLLKGAQLP